MNKRHGRAWRPTWASDGAKYPDTQHPEILESISATTPRQILRATTAAALSNTSLQFLARLTSDAFDGLDVTRHALDTSGWTNVAGIRLALAPLLERDTARRDVVVVEVGAWRGGSACAIATALKAAPALAGARLHVVSVDTWLGGPDFWSKWTIDAPDRGGALERVGGWPTVFRTFARNLKKAGHADVSAPLPISSREGARVLAHWEVAADAIFIDAAHEYAAALEDMVAYWPLLRPGGVFFGDDVTHRKVWRALEAFRACLGASSGSASCALDVATHTRSGSV